MPAKPPNIRPKNSTRMPTHISTSQGRQKMRMQLTINAATIASVAISGRHWSSNG